MGLTQAISGRRGPESALAAWWFAGEPEAGPVDDPARAVAAELDLARRARGGDEPAFRELVLRHQAKVAAMMWRFSHDRGVHAELVHDVFVEAFLSLKGFRGEAPFEHWLARVATRVGYRYWRRRERERSRRAELREAEAAPAVAADPAESAAAAELLAEALAALSPRDRLAVSLRFLEGRSVEETARLTGWSRTMVKVQTFRARRKLRALLGERLGEEFE